MPKNGFAVDRGGPPRIELEWRGLFKQVHVRCDGQVLGVIADGKALKQGRTFELPIGGTLGVRLVQGFMGTELEVTRDGMPLPGSATDPESRVKVASGIIFFVGGLSIVLGIIAALVRVEALMSIGLGFESAFFGLFYLVLGFFVRKHYSAIALGIAIALFALDGLYGVWVAIEVESSPPIGGIIFRTFLIMAMAKGFGAIRRMRLEKQTTPPSTGIDLPPRAGDDPFDPPRR
jgi:hypothetical protein